MSKMIAKINVTIIAHIDHGKSTLLAKIINLCSNRNITINSLDNLSVENERGITVKAQSVRLMYKKYQWNFIDTPGHPDFSYETDRTMLSCKNAILLIDGTKGVEAQTIYKYQQALKNGLSIIPVINKIDSDQCDIEGALEQLVDLSIDIDHVCYVSAKSGEGINQLMDTILLHGKQTNPQQTRVDALVLDSWYNSYKGVFVLIYMLGGELSKDMKLYGYHHKKNFKINQIGFFNPAATSCDHLYAGEIGYINISLKNPRDIAVGERLFANSTDKPDDDIAFKAPAHKIFATLYPDDASKTDNAKKAIEKYAPNDPSFSYEIVSSNLHKVAFHCGFLGMLHLEIVIDRIKQELGVLFRSSLPNVQYRITNQNNQQLIISSPGDWQDVIEAEEPYVRVTISILKDGYIGAIIQLCTDYLATELSIEERSVSCLMSLNLLISGFNNKLLSASNGFSSLNYELVGFKKSNLSKLEVRINDIVMDDFSIIVATKHSNRRARYFADTLVELIPRGMIEHRIQVYSGGRIIASARKKPIRKDVTQKLYGGDQSRKDKLLNKQKKGKKRMKGFEANRTIRLPKGSFSKLLSFNNAAAA